MADGLSLIQGEWLVQGNWTGRSNLKYGVVDFQPSDRGGGPLSQRLAWVPVRLRDGDRLP